MTPKELIESVEKIIEGLPDVSIGVTDLTGASRSRLRHRLNPAIEQLSDFARALDPIAQPPMVFDPTQPEIFGVIIGETMLKQPPQQLGSIPKFYGSGVYALFYSGNHKAYKRISAKNTPIYAGKANPSDPIAITPEEQSTRLWQRLNDHARSVAKVQNLKLSDFTARFLVVKSGLQVSAEEYLLNEFHPVWNEALCNGFGKHGDSPTTRANTRSEWDTLHPGRDWAWRDGNVPNSKSTTQIIADIKSHFDVFLQNE